MVFCTFTKTLLFGTALRTDAVGYDVVRMPMIAPGGIIKLRRMKLVERTTPVSKPSKFCDPLQVHSPHRPLKTG